MNLVSQSEAARIADVSRQAIGDLKRTGTYNFFEGKKVDIDSPDWKAYLSNRGNGSAVEKKSDNKKNTVKPPLIKLVKNNVPRGTSRKPSEKVVDKKQNNKKKSETEHSNSSNRKEYDRDYSLSGGVDPLMFTPQTPGQLKQITEVISKNLDMQIKLSEYVERKMVVSMLESIGHTIQSHFVDLPRKQSSRITKKLKRVGMEKEVEKILGKPIADGIVELKRVTQKALIDLYKKR